MYGNHDVASKQILFPSTWLGLLLGMTVLAWTFYNPDATTQGFIDIFYGWNKSIMSVVIIGGIVGAVQGFFLGWVNFSVALTLAGERAMPLFAEELRKKRRNVILLTTVLMTVAYGVWLFVLNTAWRNATFTDIALDQLPYFIGMLVIAIILEMRYFDNIGRL